MMEIWQLAIAQMRGSDGGGISPWMWLIPVAIVVLIILARALRVLKEYDGV